MDDIAIKVDSVGKVFKLPHEKHSSLKSAFVNLVRPNKGYEMQQALKDISFEVKKGEFFGIVGRNGSGKSTMLKLLAGIYTPTKGTVQVNGKLTPFIELGVGFNPELTGRENVYLNGALLGFSRKKMGSMYNDIVEFAELKRFMDQKLKNYSSGMQVRLAFSIAIRAESDILLIDEVLAVGDADFQRKCFSYFKTLKKNNKTVVFISHDMGAVREFCDRGILVDGGEVVYAGDAQSVADNYSKMFMVLQEVGNSGDKPRRYGNGDAKIVDVLVKVSDDNIVVIVEAKIKKDIEDLQYGFHIWREDGYELIGMNNRMLRKPDIKKVKASSTVIFTWRTPNIYSQGKYYLTLALADGVGNMLDRFEEATSFVVKRLEHSNTSISPPIDVEYKLKN